MNDLESLKAELVASKAREEALWLEVVRGRIKYRQLEKDNRLLEEYVRLLKLKKEPTVTELAKAAPRVPMATVPIRQAPVEVHHRRENLTLEESRSLMYMLRRGDSVIALSRQFRMSRNAVYTFAKRNGLTLPPRYGIRVEQHG